MHSNIYYCKRYKYPCSRLGLPTNQQWTNIYNELGMRKPMARNRNLPIPTASTNKHVPTFQIPYLGRMKFNNIAKRRPFST